MTDGVKKIGDARLAQRFLGTAFENMDEAWGSYYYNACQSLEIESAACTTLNFELLHGFGDVFPRSVESLRSAGFSDEFINELAGPDGKRFDNMRLEHFSRWSVTRWWRTDLSPWRRKQAIDEIAKYKSEGAYAVPYLIEASADDNRDVREAAIYALEEIHAYPEKSIPVLLEYYKRAYEDNGWRRGRLHLFGREAVSFLIDEIDRYIHKDESYVCDLIYTLGEIGNDAKEVWPHLVKIGDAAAVSTGIQTAIAFSLVDIGAPPEIAIPRFTEAVKQIDYFDSNSIHPRLLKLPNIPDDLFLLVKASLEDSGTDQDVISILKKANPQLAKPILIGKLSFGYVYESYAKALSEMMLEPSDMDLLVKRAADYINDSVLEIALQNVSDECVDRLMAISSSASGEKKLRTAATRLLGFANNQRQDVIDYLLNSLTDNIIVFGASDALTIMGDKAIPPLLLNIKDKKFRGRGTAVQILGEIHMLPDVVVQELIKIVAEDDDINVRKSAIIALRRYARDHPESLLPAVPLLMTFAANNEASEIRLNSIWCLGFLAHRAREALPVLEMIKATDPDPEHKRAAESAMEQILFGVL